MDETKPTFKEWVSQFADENSIIGDLAGDISRDNCWPDDNTYEKCLNHLKFHKTPKTGIEAFKELWKNYGSFGFHGVLFGRGVVLYPPSLGDHKGSPLHPINSQRAKIIYQNSFIKKTRLFSVTTSKTG